MKYFLRRSLPELLVVDRRSEQLYRRVKRVVTKVFEQVYYLVVQVEVKKRNKRVIESFG